MADINTGGAAFTPGPWKVGPFGAILPDNGVDTAGIASVSTKSGFLPNWEANSSLITAAPEMFDVLLECRKLAKLAEQLTGCRADDEYVWGIQKRIDAVISKARSQSSGGEDE